LIKHSKFRKRSARNEEDFELGKISESNCEIKMDDVDRWLGG